MARRPFHDLNTASIAYCELLLRVGRELDARFVLHDLLERLDQTGEVVGGQLGVDAHALALDEVVQRLLEQLAGDVEHDLAEHLHEAAVRVVREALVLRLLGETLDRVVVEPEVQDRVHHPGHRERRTGTHGDEQRVVGVAEQLAHLLLELLAGHRDLGHQARGQLVAERHVGLARVGADREAGRHGQPEVRHLGEVRALAAEQVFLVAPALFERVDVLLADLAPTSRTFQWDLVNQCQRR